MKPLFQVPGPLFQTEATLLAFFIVIILVGLAARYFRLPYTTILVLAGLGLGFLRFLPVIELTPELVLLLFLPPLAFEAAFHLDFEHLQRDVVPIGVFALLGVLVTMLVTGAILVWGLGWSWEIALLFGTLVAATDPVSVVAIFRELGVTKRLSTLVEGESLFNDGTSIVLFRIVLAIVIAGRADPAAGLLEFLRLVLGGAALGFVLGYLTSRLLRQIDDYLIEISSTVVLAWGSYLLGEFMGVSGVISVVVAGLVLGNYGGRISFSPTTKIVLGHVLEFIAFVANSFIFLLIGIQIVLDDIAEHLVPILWAVFAMLVARAVAVYGLSFPLGRLSAPIPFRWRHLIFWGGLRGGLTLALALSLPIDVPLRSSLILAAFGVVLFTLVFQGLTIRPLLEILRLVPREDVRVEYEKKRGRLLALRFGERRLKRMLEEGSLSEQAYAHLASRYAPQAGVLEEELQDLHNQHPELVETESATAELEALRAQRSALIDLKRRGLVSDEVYRELTGEIDARLQKSSRTSAQLRPIEERPVDVPSENHGTN